jgi:hypothetical protein
MGKGPSMKRSSIKAKDVDWHIVKNPEFVMMATAMKI